MTASFTHERLVTLMRARAVVNRIVRMCLSQILLSAQVDDELEMISPPSFPRSTYQLQPQEFDVSLSLPDPLSGESNNFKMVRSSIHIQNPNPTASLAANPPRPK